MLFVSSQAQSDAGTLTVGFTNAISLASNGPSGTLSFAVATQVDFDIVVTDPCLTTTVDGVII